MGIARELARRGRDVILVARSADKLEELATELTATGVRAEVLPTDLSDRDARAELPDRVTELGLWVNILVNNAGLGTTGAIQRADPDSELNMVEINVMALVDLTTRFLPTMVDHREGAILNVASTAAFQPLPGQTGYAASKAFVLSYTQGLSGELRGTNVTATALCPGPVHTGFNDVAGMTREQAEAAMPRFMWQPVESVARCGVDAVAAGRTVAIPGAAGKVTAVLGHLTPKDLLVPLVAKRHPRLRS